MSEEVNNGSTNEPLDFNGNLPVHMTLAAFTGIAWYNVIELNLSVYLTFKRRRGLYFWSVIACIQGIGLHSLAFILKLYGVVTTYQITITMITIGWYLMVTGQALVLYSRLHLIVSEPRIVRAVLIMILFNAVTMHFPTTVLTYGSNSPHHELFTEGFRVMEKLQMTMFTVQELIISGIYIWATLRFLRPAYRRHIRSVMVQLLWINVAVIIMDLSMVTMEYIGLYYIEAVMKGAIYSVKLKLEFAVLNQLMQIASTPRDRAGMVEPHDSKDSLPFPGRGNPRQSASTAARASSGMKGWFKHMLPGPPSSAEGIDGGANTYYISPSVLQSTASTRHHQQQRNVSSRRPHQFDGTEHGRHPSHGIAMTTEIRQDFSTAAELDEEAANKGRPGLATQTSKGGTFYQDTTHARDTSFDDGAASDKTDVSQLELMDLPSSSSSYEANNKLPKYHQAETSLNRPRPTAQPSWSKRSPPPIPPDEPIPMTLQSHRPSVSNLKGGMDTQSRTSSEAQLRL
jgi:hypothetical protein